MILMPFGAHRGEPLDEVPEEYLAWALTLPNLSTTLRQAVEQQLNLQDRPDWLESAACALPRVVWKWETRMRLEFADEPAAEFAVNRGAELLRELCAKETGQPWPDEVPDGTDPA